MDDREPTIKNVGLAVELLRQEADRQEHDGCTVVPMMLRLQADELEARLLERYGTPILMRMLNRWWL